MGITWKAMPLLSTLAALVIIVHSAEEDFEPDYRDLRPRRLETVTASYEQPWRVLDTEPVAVQPTQAEWDVSRHDEQPKRRRPVRKRKRRPITPSEDDLIPQERQVYHDEYRPYQHETLSPQVGIIRRRRKQFDSKPLEHTNTWTDEAVDRPLIRKRGQKRKRPQVEETWPDLSEFNAFIQNDNNRENDGQAYVEPIETVKYEQNTNYDNTGEVYLPNDKTVNIEFEEVNPVKHTHKEDENIQYPPVDNIDNSRYKVNEKKEDKSLSEFSLESPSSIEDLKSTQEKIEEKSLSTYDEEEKPKSNGPLDPQTLKEILKKSNGRSLSEILQQHNLSLVDLLHGKEKAIAVLREEGSLHNESEAISQFNDYSTVSNENMNVKNENTFQNRKIDPNPNESLRDAIIIKHFPDEPTVSSTDKSSFNEPVTDYSITKLTKNSEKRTVNNVAVSPTPLPKLQLNTQATDSTTKSLMRRRYPVGIRRKIRMRPTNNTVYKSQLSRDLIALTSRRYQLSRNSSRSREWKDMLPTQVKVNRKEEVITERYNEMELANEEQTTIYIPEVTTILEAIEENKSTIPETEQSTTNIQTTSTESMPTITTLDVTVTENIPTTTTTSTTTTTTTTEKPTDKPAIRPVVKASDLRRQAFNNRLKRKRLKQKTTTTEPTQGYVMKDIFGMANLVSASEFIAKIQPRTTSSEDELDFTTLEDFMTTESSTKAQTKSKSTRIPKTKHSTTHASFPVDDTEETAKIEIEEILNDTLTSARLSKILMERNMTINELVEHRERGSSHIHLADIFHNASREPNPPEPFLSKSLIEPISKETYPLRALLEANLHDPTAKATTIDPNSTQSHYLNIPVVMDFGNNVNENGENMGIMSLFNNFTKSLNMDGNTSEVKEQLQDTSSLAPQNIINRYEYGSTRESRTLNTDKDLVTWKEIIAIMHRGQNNATNEVMEVTTREISPSQAIRKTILDDLDGDDGLIVLNNLQHLKDIDNQAASSDNDNLEMHMQEKTELPQVHGVLNKSSNSAKSVTVATASIIGLAMVLFLLTYAVFRWKQQRTMFRDKQSMRTDRIPTPIFENRKGHKNNSSTRSKSPMISSSNIYSINTLDNRNGNDSPEYMWDSLRKPFQ